MRVYSSDEVHAALPWVPLAEALAAAFVADAQVPLRHVHALSDQDRLLLMPAWDARIVLIKVVTVLPPQPAPGRPKAAEHPLGGSHQHAGTGVPRATPATVQATVLALDRASGTPLAVLDGEALTLRRTAATSALAARHLARADAHTLLLVGCGRLAGWMARAHAALRPALRQVQVWGRRPDAAAALAGTLAQEGLPARAVHDLEPAARAACIICCTTTSTMPLVHGAWLAAGTHLDLVGSFTPGMREVDDAAVARARIVVDTHAGALAEAGDLVQPLARGVIGRRHVAGELADLLRGDVQGRTHAGEITLFKSVGTAIEDLAAAQLVMG